METNQDYAKITLIVYKKGTYSSIEGEVGLKIYKPIEFYIRFSDLLNNPRLVAKLGESIKPKITVKTESGEQNISLSDIVIALENAKYRGNRFDRMRTSRSSLKKEYFSFLTKDNQYQISGYIINLKKQMKSKFIVFSDDTPIGHLFPEEIKHKDYVSINDLIKGKISKHTFAAINPEYFNIPSKYK